MQKTPVVGSLCPQVILLAGSVYNVAIDAGWPRSAGQLTAGDGSHLA